MWIVVIYWFIYYLAIIYFYYCIWFYHINMSQFIYNFPVNLDCFCSFLSSVMNALKYEYSHMYHLLHMTKSLYIKIYETHDICNMFTYFWTYIDVWVIGYLNLQLYQILQTIFFKCLYTGSVFHIFTKAWYCRHWQFVPLEGTKWNNSVTVICICLISYEEECISACILAICLSHSVKCLLFTIFLLNCFNQFLWKYFYLFFM